MTNPVKPIQIWDYPEACTGTEQRAQLIAGICDRFLALSAERQRELLARSLSGNSTGCLFELKGLIDQVAGDCSSSSE